MTKLEKATSIPFSRLLLKYPVDINHENRNKMRALHLAAKIGNYESVKLLIGKKAVINCRNNNYRTPMMMACLFTHADDQKIIEFFLRSGANIERRDLNNCTPLLLASQECNVPAVHTLLKNKANIMAVDTENKTSLFHAAERNHKEVVERLLKDPVKSNFTQCWLNIDSVQENMWARLRDSSPCTHAIHATQPSCISVFG